MALSRFPARGAGSGGEKRENVGKEKGSRDSLNPPLVPFPGWKVGISRIRGMNRSWARGEDSLAVFRGEETKKVKKKGVQSQKK